MNDTLESEYWLRLDERIDLEGHTILLYWLSALKGFILLMISSTLASYILAIPWFVPLLIQIAGYSILIIREGHRVPTDQDGRRLFQSSMEEECEQALLYARCIEYQLLWALWPYLLLPFTLSHLVYKLKVSEWIERVLYPPLTVKE